MSENPTGESTVVLPQKAPGRSRLERWKDIASLIQSWATVVALGCAGVWFYTGRQSRPRIKIDHVISQRPFAGKEAKTMVGVGIQVTNIGNVRVQLQAGYIKIAEWNPEEKDFEEDKTKAADLEPGEIEQIFFEVYFIETSIKTLRIKTALDTPDGESEWSYESLFDIPGNLTKESGIRLGLRQ